MHVVRLNLFKGTLVTCTYRKITIFKVCALWSFMHIWSIIAIHTSRNVLCGCMYVLKYYLEHAWIDRKQLEKIFLFFLIITFKVRHASFEERIESKNECYLFKTDWIFPKSNYVCTLHLVSYIQIRVCYSCQASQKSITFPQNSRVKK